MNRDGKTIVRNRATLCPLLSIVINYLKENQICTKMPLGYLIDFALIFYLQKVEFWIQDYVLLIQDKKYFKQDFLIIPFSFSLSLQTVSFTIAK